MFRFMRAAGVFCAAALLAAAAGRPATAQQIDLGALGINWNFELPDVDAADSNTGEVTSTNNPGPGWNYTLMGGAVANYGVGDPTGDTTSAAPHYCCYSATPTGGVLPAPFEGRQIGFFNLPDTDSIAQFASLPVGTLLAGQTYSLTISLGARATNDWADVNYAIGLATSTGVDLGAMATLTMNPDAGNTMNIQELTYALNVNVQAAAFVGQDASIVIRANNGFTGGASPPDFVQANFDNVRLSGTFGAPTGNAPALTIDRATGVVTLSKAGTTNFNIIGYEIASNSFGSLNHANWTKVSVAYDDSGNGSVDADDEWTVLSAADDNTDMSEAELDGGNGGVLATGAPINLGAAWIKTPLQDVQAKLLLAGNIELNVPVSYVGDAIPAGDLNGSASVNTADWTIFKAGQGVSFVGLSAAERYQLGDLNNDGAHDLADFSAFRFAYDAANGAGAFAAMLAVPEPASALALTLGGVLLAGRSRRRLRVTRIAPLAALMAAILLSGASTASAQSVIAHWSYDAADTTLVGGNIATIADDSGNHDATGVFNGTTTITQVPGQFGEAGLFGNGLGTQAANNAYFSVPQLTEIAGTTGGDFSVSTWVKTTNVTNTNNILATWEGTGNNTYWFSLANQDTNTTSRPRGQFRSSNTPNDDIVAITLGAADPTPDNVANDAWHHISWTWTKSTKTLVTYVDGIASNATVSGDAIVDILPSAVTTGFIGRKGDNNQYFIGSMDELWVHGAALTAQEVDNLRLFNRTVPERLTLVIDQANGQMQIKNDATTNLMPITISGYEISSASGGLDLANWSRLATQGLTGFPVGNGSGNGWEAGAASSNNELAEWYLTGESTMGPGATAGLGSAYNQTLDATDVVFKYSTGAGSVIQGIVAFGTVDPPSNPADFDNNGTVNGADLTIWRNNYGNAATKATGDANGDGLNDGADFLIWQQNLGAGPAVAAQSAVPEPASVALAAVAGLALTRLRRRRAALPAALLACVAGAGVAGAAVTVDRTYRFGDDPGEIGQAGFTQQVGVGTAGNVTFDSTGVAATGTFQDLTNGLAASTAGPTYADVSPTGLNRPGAGATEHGVAFDGIDDYLNGLRLGFPGTTASSTFGGGTQNYKGLSNRGFQLWVRPNSAGNGVEQSIVSDANQHGVRINAAGQWVMRYNANNVASSEPVAFNAWSHVMVVRPQGTVAPTGGSILYVNGEAVAAAAGNYNVNPPNPDNPLVVGASNTLVEGFNGTLDELTMFVLGKTVDGVDRGTFNLRADNAFAAAFLKPNPADVNQDGSLTAADVTAFVAGWGSVNLVNNVRVGDVNTILDGDLNFDGATNLADAGILNGALAAAGLPALDFSALPIPEPTAAMIAASLACLVAASRRTRVGSRVRTSSYRTALPIPAELRRRSTTGSHR